MKDSELRGSVLRFLYDHRRDDIVIFGAIQHATEIPDGIDPKDGFRAGGQLADHNLIEWHPHEDHTGDGVLGGAAKINGFGTDVIEEGAQPPISIVLDQRQYVQMT